MGKVTTYAAALILLLLTGCATPKIDTAKFAPPKTVLIDDFPAMNHAATIAVLVTNWPAPYFSSPFDAFYNEHAQASVADNSAQTNQIITNQILQSPRPVSVGTGAAMGAVGGLVGGIIQASAEATQRRAAEFPSLLRKTMPNVDMHDDVIKLLRKSLEAKGIVVKLASERRNLPIRLRWPATDEKGVPVLDAPTGNGPPVDADMLLQLAPIAIYAAPGPLNSYERRVGIAIAMFDGRTRQFIGWQAFPWKSDGKFEYMKYDSLVEDLPNAGPALHDALLSLVPQVVDVVSGKHL